VPGWRLAWDLVTNFPVAALRADPVEPPPPVSVRVLAGCRATVAFETNFPVEALR